MHIPDGFLDPKTAVITAALAAAGLAFALRNARRTLSPRKIPLLGLSAAFVFAAQMINFPVVGGVSGHLVGGVLTAVLLGPSAAVIVISAVLIVQCLAFADGGITALGANIFNMGIIGGAVGGMIYLALARLASGLRGRLLAAAAASWIAIVLAALACAGEVASTDTAPFATMVKWMSLWHALIGIGEAVITTLVLSAIASVRPELIVPNAAPPATPHAASWRSAPLMPILVFGLIASVGIALFLSPWASRLPDGLNYVAHKLHFDAQESSHPSLLADYTPLAAALATLVLFALVWLLARGLSAKAKNTGRPE